VRTEAAGWLAVRRVVVVLGTEGNEVAIYRGENGEEAFGQRWCPRRGFLFLNQILLRGKYTDF
jgi:hypothetical protein